MRLPVRGDFDYILKNNRNKILFRSCSFGTYEIHHSPVPEMFRFGHDAKEWKNGSKS